ncbi:MAG: DUF1015 domain-containing protein [Rhodospirillaceae bacterium]
MAPVSPLIRPLKGLRPAPGQAAAVAAPPYDVLDTQEARARAEGKPYSFLHISKPEIDLPLGTNPYAPEVYAKGAANLADMIAKGILIRDEKPCYYVYRQHMGAHVQTGLVVTASIAAYDINQVRKHEFTRPDKEDDRVRQIEALNAETGPVLAAHKANPEVRAIMDKAASGAPLYDVTADTGVRHMLWRIDDAATIERLSRIFDQIGVLYIADGHHRSASASRVAAARRKTKEGKSDSHEYFLTVSFPHDELNILDYNRVVTDLNGLDAAGFLKKLEERFTVTRVQGQLKPDRTARFGLYLDGAWYQLDLAPQFIPSGDPVARLDVSLLQDNLIGPVLGILDQRTDKRIDFIGGIRGLTELEKRVDSGKAKAAFALHPTTMEQLMAVADANQVMPPKSTWFEPKLADGLVSHVLD